MNKKEIILLLLCSLSIFQSDSLQLCEPKDEFENENTTTTEWDQFMEKLTDLTFNKNYTKKCQNDQNQEVLINYSSDFLWELRFKLYSERQQGEGKTIEQCYSVQGKSNCNKEDFMECMKKARTAMFQELQTFWDSAIDDELEILALEC